MGQMFMNLTPHAVIVVNDYGDDTIIEPSGLVARINSKDMVIGHINGVPITRKRFEEIEGLPQPEKNLYFIVSYMIAARCKDRDDLLVPNELIKDRYGRVIGCRSLGKA